MYKHSFHLTPFSIFTPISIPIPLTSISILSFFFFKCPHTHFSHISYPSYPLSHHLSILLSCFIKPATISISIPQYPLHPWLSLTLPPSHPSSLKLPSIPSHAHAAHMHACSPSWHLQYLVVHTGERIMKDLWVYMLQAKISAWLQRGSEELPKDPK